MADLRTGIPPLSTLIADAAPVKRPCYICAVSVPLTEGWHLDGRQWCENHEPVWGHLRLKCEALHPDSNKGYAPVKCSRRLGHGGDHAATIKGPRDQWWTPRVGDVPEASERRCVQHGYDYSAICSICGPWWREQASPEERRTLHLLAAPLMAGRESAEREDEA